MLTRQFSQLGEMIEAWLVRKGNIQHLQEYIHSELASSENSKRVLREYQALA